MSLQKKYRLIFEKALTNRFALAIIKIKERKIAEAKKTTTKG